MSNDTVTLANMRSQPVCNRSLVPDRESSTGFGHTFGRGSPKANNRTLNDDFRTVFNRNKMTKTSIASTTSERSSSPAVEDMESSDGFFRFPTIAEVKQHLRADVEVTEEAKTQAWTEAAEAVGGAHDELIQRLKTDMDSHLVFAGLFSAVLTAFNVQSYQLLQPPMTDPAIAILQQISDQLSSFSVTPSFVNSTQTARPLSEIAPPFRAPPSAVWINALWFSSLVCSLASASISLIVKQWLQEQTAGLSGTSQEIARVRKYRLNGLLKWRVGLIIVFLPILLQLALVLFLAGLIILVWTLHDTVAVVTSAFVAALFAFLAIVTVLPAFRWDCCYRSHQALAVYVTMRPVNNAIKRVTTRFLSALWIRTSPGSQLSNFLWSYRGWWRQPTYMPAWDGKDELCIASSSGALDREILTMAYSATLSPKHLENLPLILPDLPVKELGSCFEGIYTAWDRQWGDNAMVRSADSRRKFLVRPLVHMLGHMVTDDVAESYSEDEWDRVACMIMEYLEPFSMWKRTNDQDRDGYLNTLCLVALRGQGLNRSSLRALVCIRLYVWFVIHKDDKTPWHALAGIMVACEHIVRTWNTRKVTLEALHRWFISIQTAMRCVQVALKHHTGTGPPSDNIGRICRKAREILGLVRDRLSCEEDWTAVEALPSAVEQERAGSISGLTSPRGILLYALQENLYDCVSSPLREICGAGGLAQGWAVVPDRFVESLEKWWTSMKGGLLDEAEQDTLCQEYEHRWLVILKNSIAAG